MYDDWFDTFGEPPVKSDSVKISQLCVCYFLFVTWNLKVVAELCFLGAYQYRMMFFISAEDLPQM